MPVFHVIMPNRLRLRYSFLFAGGLAVVFALLLRWLTRGPVNLSRRDGFGVVTFGWLTVTVFGSLPYLFSGVISHPISALFETMSGFTTTGATVVSNLESIPHSIHFWRHLTQWLGGMGGADLVYCNSTISWCRWNASVSSRDDWTIKR